MMEALDMRANEYQQAALRTASKTEPTELIINGALGLCGESGEVADVVKKFMFQGHPLEKEHLAKELGDICWYIAITAKGLGYDLETIMKMNVEKLWKRYPNGFEIERSLHREENE